MLTTVGSHSELNVAYWSVTWFSIDSVKGNNDKTSMSEKVIMTFHFAVKNVILKLFISNVTFLYFLCFKCLSQEKKILWMRFMTFTFCEQARLYKVVCTYKLFTLLR